MTDRANPRAGEGERTLRKEKFISTDTEEEEDAESVMPTQLSQPPDAAAEARHLTLIIQQELDSVGEDDETRARLLHSLGLVIEHRQGDRRRAMYHLLEAHRLRPENLTYLRSLRHNLWSRGNWPLVVRLLDAEFNLLKDPARRAALLVLKGELCRELLADTEAAVEAYMEALRLEPEDLRVLSRARLLLALTGQRRRQVEVCRQYAAATTDGELRGLLLTEAGRVCEDYLEDEEAALDDYAHALEQDPHNATALARRKQLLEQLGRLELLVEVLVQEGEIAGPGERRIAALTRAAGICRDQLDRPGWALELLALAHTHTGGFPLALEALAREPLDEATQERLHELMMSRAEVLEDRRQQAEILFYLGTRQASGSGDATHLFRQALERVPDHPGALEAVLRGLMQEEAWDEALQVAERAIERTEDDGLRLDLFHRMGELCAARLGDLDRARGFHVRALAQAPGDLESLDALRGLYWRAEEHERLLDVLEQLALRANQDREAVSLLHEKAQVVGRHFPRQDAALVYERILELDPQDATALEALDRIYSVRADNAGICRVLSVLSSQEEDQQHREALLLRLAGAREAVGDAASAAWALGMVAPQTRSLVVAKELRRLRQLQAQWDMVVESLEQEARLSLDARLRGRSLMTAAKILEDRLEDPDRAENVLWRILEEDPLHSAASERLDLMLGKRGRWSRLASVLKLRISALGEREDAGRRPQDRLELLFRLAEIQWLHLEQPREAIASARRSLDLDPMHRPSLRFLGPLHAEQEQWAEAAEVYSRLMAICHDTEELRTIHRRLGEIFSEHLNQPLQAISCYQNTLAIVPGDNDALWRLHELFVEVGDRDSAADTLTQLIEVTDDPMTRATLNISLADLYDKGFDEPVLAVEHLQQAQHMDPTNESILSRLKELLTRLDQWEDLCDAIRSFLAALPVDQQARGFQYRMELGEVMQQRLRRPAEGLEQYQAVIDLDPTNLEARHAAARVLVEDNRLDEAVRAYREILDIDAADTRSLRELRAIWARVDELDGAYAATAVLVYLGEASDGEARFYEERRGKGASYPRRCMEPSAFETVLVHPSEHSNGRGVLSVLVRVAHQIYPPRLQAWGVGPQSLLSHQSEHPLQGIVAQVSRVLGLEFRVDVHLSDKRPHGMDLLLTDPPTLVAGVDVMEDRSPLEVRCEVGRLLSYVRNDSWIAHRLDHKELGALVVCACMAAGATMKQSRSSGRDTRLRRARQIQSSLAPDDMTDLEEACNALRKGREPDFEVWAQSMQHTALRTSLWVTNDLETVLDQVLDNTGAEPETDHSAAARESTLAMDLVRYWMSEDFLALRKTLG